MNCPKCVAHLAEIAACQARVAGMEAENAQYPESQPYGEKAFFAEAARLDEIAAEARNH